MCTRADALHLYDRVAFLGSKLPDGSAADRNYLWLSPWYLANLNARFTAPIDYALWRRLDERSSIASRLYEFLLPNFYSGAPVLRINYYTLARFLPVRAEQYRSCALRQLTPALTLLQDAGIVASVDWTESKVGKLQMHIHPGPLLTTRSTTPSPVSEIEPADLIEEVDVRELRNVKPPEWELVVSFYRVWANTDAVKPSKSELAAAHRLIADHGPAKAKSLVMIATNSMKLGFPDAKTFGALTRYIPDAITEHGRQQLLTEARQAAATASRHESDQRIRRRILDVRDQVTWSNLSEEAKNAIRTRVVNRSPRMRLDKTPRMLEKLCIHEISNSRRLRR